MKTFREYVESITNVSFEETVLWKQNFNPIKDKLNSMKTIFKNYFPFPPTATHINLPWIGLSYANFYIQNNIDSNEWNLSKINKNSNKHELILSTHNIEELTNYLNKPKSSIA